MKQLLSIFSILLVMNIANCFSQNVKKVDLATLPTQSQDFIRTHLDTSVEVLNIEKKWNKYEVKLSNGIEIDFDKNGIWRNIESNHIPLPSSIINLLPKSIIDRINTDYKNWHITDINKKRYGFDIELVNPVNGDDVELEFSPNGELLKIDY